MLNLFKKQPLIGIDISDHLVKILQLSKKREVLAYAEGALDSGIVDDGKIIKKEELAAKIRELIENAKYGRFIDLVKPRAILSLPESKIFTYFFNIEKGLKEEKLEQKILEEALNIMPVDLESIYWDYITAQDKNGQIVLYAGVMKKIADDYIETILLAGIEPVILDIEVESLSRSLIKPAFLKSGTMIIDIGTRTTNISVFDKNDMIGLSIIIPIAGMHFTKILSKKLKIKDDEAEKIKKEKGLNKNKQDNKVFLILDQEMRLITDEIKRAINYFEDKYIKIGTIVLTGGSALMPEIDKYFSDNLGRETKVGNPLGKIKNSNILEKENKPVLFSNVIGLALRGSENFLEGINLFRQKKITRKLDLKMPKLSEFKLPKFKLPKFRIPAFSFLVKNKKIMIISFFFIVMLFLGLVLYKYIFKLLVGKPDNIGQEITESVDNSGDIPLPEETIKIQKIKITNTPTGWLNVREGPGTNYKKITKVSPDSRYDLLEEKNDWFKIKIDDKTEGWITSEYATKE